MRFDLRLAPDGAAGSVETFGTWRAAPGDTLSTTGFGNRFSGNYRVSAVEHVFRNGEWTTRLSLSEP